LSSYDEEEALVTPLPSLLGSKVAYSILCQERMNEKLHFPKFGEFIRWLIRSICSINSFYALPLSFVAGRRGVDLSEFKIVAERFLRSL
jgi:hypothetical protein